MRKVNIQHALLEFDKNAHYFNQLNKKPAIKQNVRQKIFDLQGQIHPISMAHICDITKYDATDSQKEEVREIFLDNINDLIDLNEAKLFLNYHTMPNEFAHEKYGSLNSFLSAAFMTADLFFFMPTAQIPNVRYILDILANEYFAPAYYDDGGDDPTPETIMKYKYFYVNTIISYTYEYLKALDQTKYDYIFDYAPKVSTLESMIYLLSIFNDEHDNTSKDGRSSSYEDAYNFINVMYTYLQNSISVVGYDTITYGDTNTSKMHLDALDRDPGFEPTPDYICDVRTFGNRMEELLNVISNNNAYGIYTNSDVAPEDKNDQNNPSFDNLYEDLLNQIIPDRNKKSDEHAKSGDGEIEVNKKCCSSDKSACTGQCKHKDKNETLSESKSSLPEWLQSLIYQHKSSNEDENSIKNKDEKKETYTYNDWGDLADDDFTDDYLDFLRSLHVCDDHDIDKSFDDIRNSCKIVTENLKKQQDEAAKQKVQEKDNTKEDDPIQELTNQFAKLFKTIFPDIQFSDSLRVREPEQRKPEKPKTPEKQSKSIHDVPVKKYKSYDEAMNDSTLSDEVKNFLHFVETVFE